MYCTVRFGYIIIQESFEGKTTRFPGEAERMRNELRTKGYPWLYCPHAQEEHKRFMKKQCVVEPVDVMYFIGVSEPVNHCPLEYVESVDRIEASACI